jgi:hypothetical protein
MIMAQYSTARKVLFAFSVCLPLQIAIRYSLFTSNDLSQSRAPEGSTTIEV